MPSIRRVAGLLTSASILSASIVSASNAAASPASYPEGARHSPMTTAVVAKLSRVLSSSTGNRDAFVKIGDSNTANPTFLNCLAAREPRLGAHLDLDDTRRFFGVHSVSPRVTSWNRTSLAATVGWLAGNVLAGQPSFLDEEIAAVKPAFAVVMLGTNDNRPSGLPIFTENLTRVIDRTLAAGVVPLVSTIPPRDDSSLAEARVVEINRVIRGLAESRQVPLMDLHAALLPLPRHGLVRDGIHLSTVWEKGAPRPCRFTDEGLEKGMNTRNLLVLEALDRARKFLIDGRAPEAEPVPGV